MNKKPCFPAAAALLGILMITALPVDARGPTPRQRLPDGQKVEGFYLEPDGRIRVAYDDDGDGMVDRYESIPVDSLAEARRQRMRERFPAEFDEAFEAAEPDAGRDEGTAAHSGPPEAITRAPSSARES